MPIRWSEQAQNSLFEILKYYETEVNQTFADSVEDRIVRQVEKIQGFETAIPKSEVYPNTRKLVISKLPYVAFIRERSSGAWELVDIVHTSRKLPK